MWSTCLRGTFPPRCKREVADLVTILRILLIIVRLLHFAGVEVPRESAEVGTISIIPSDQSVLLTSCSSSSYAAPMRYKVTWGHKNGSGSVLIRGFIGEKRTGDVFPLVYGVTPDLFTIYTPGLRPGLRETPIITLSLSHYHIIPVVSLSLLRRRRYAHGVPGQGVSTYEKRHPASPHPPFAAVAELAAGLEVMRSP
jgi:hypothetical protein